MGPSPPQIGVVATYLMVEPLQCVIEKASGAPRGGAKKETFHLLEPRPMCDGVPRGARRALNNFSTQVLYSDHYYHENHIRSAHVVLVLG